MKKGEKKMKREFLPDVPIVETLRGIMDGNTLYYKLDFDYDIQTIQDLYNDHKEKSKVLLWMSRDCGTWCFRLRDVLLEPTCQRNTWLYYDQDKFNSIQAYMVALKGEKEGVIYGNIYRLDYGAYCKHLLTYKVAVAYYRMTYENGEVYASSLPRFFEDNKYGKLLDVSAQPGNPSTLQDNMIHMEASTYGVL